LLDRRRRHLLSNHPQHCGGSARKKLSTIEHRWMGGLKIFLMPENTLAKPR
jgi:hypothetical protein